MMRAYFHPAARAIMVATIIYREIYKVAKKPSKSRKMSVYSNLTHKRKVKKDKAARKKAEYLATLPKQPLLRTLHRMHPKRVARFWFSKQGLIFGTKLAGVGILLGVLLIGGLFAYYRKDLDAIRPGEIQKRVQTTITRYEDRNGVLLWEDKGDGNYTMAVESDQISEVMKQATVAIEDRDFYSHSGISIPGITRSVINNINGRSTQGGSTLTQQLVKQVFFADEAHMRGFDGVPRKIKEIILAIEVERMYDKEEILKLYLNESSYGGRRNGVESGARTYFGKGAIDLNLAEASLLAAIPNQPGLYDPYNVAGNNALIARQHKVLDDMVAMQFITREEADEAKKVAILDTLEQVTDQFTDIIAPHFVQMVRSQLEAELGKATVGRGGLTVKTTLDSRIQNRLEESMAEMFNSSMPTFAGFTNGAATVEDTKTGQIIAMMGSRNFNYPGFGQDNAATAFIQPGSTIKPFVYAQLFSKQPEGKQNYGSGSILTDDNTMNTIYGGPLRNADGRFMGGINVRRALALSRNVPAVKAMYVAGVQETLESMRATGNKNYCTQGADAQAGLSASIGGCGTRQIDLVNAFATLGRGGTYKPTSAVLEVKNSQGQVIKQYADVPDERVLDEEVSYIISDILRDDNARAGLYGPRFYGLHVPGVETAVKTGTSDKDGKAKDIWTASYSPALSMAVWLGNSDTSVLRNGNSSIPARIIGQVMEYAHKEIYAQEGKWKPGDWLARPAGIQQIRGELYPSWYDQRQSQTGEEITFDRVSKKRATECTPESARVQHRVVRMIDPVTNRPTYSATDGYNPNENDDAHDCGDAKPIVTVEAEQISGNRYRFTASVNRGKAAIRDVVIAVDGQVIATLTGGSYTTPPYTFTDNATKTITATVTDELFYTHTHTIRETPES